jgi:hypothetical protein
VLVERTVVVGALVMVEVEVAVEMVLVRVVVVVLMCAERREEQAEERMVGKLVSGVGKVAARLSCTSRRVFGAGGFVYAVVIGKVVVVVLCIGRMTSERNFAVHIKGQIYKVLRTKDGTVSVERLVLNLGAVAGKGLFLLPVSVKKANDEDVVEVVRTVVRTASLVSLSGCSRSRSECRLCHGRSA